MAAFSIVTFANAFGSTVNAGAIPVPPGTTLTDTADAWFNATFTGATVSVPGAGSSGGTLDSTITFLTSTTATLGTAASTAVTTASYLASSIACDWNGTTTIKLTVPNAVQAGDALVLSFFPGSGANLTVTVTDNGSGGTWTQLLNTTAGGPAQYYVYGVVAKQAAASLQITLVFSGTVKIRLNALYQVRPPGGMVSVFDVSAVGTGTGTALSSGNVTTHYPTAIALGLVVCGASFSAVGTGYTASLALQGLDTTVDDPSGCGAEFQLLSSAQTLAATATQNASTTWAMAIVVVGSQPAAGILSTVVRDPPVAPASSLLRPSPAGPSPAGSDLLGRLPQDVSPVAPPMIFVAPAASGIVSRLQQGPPQDVLSGPFTELLAGFTPVPGGQAMFSGPAQDVAPALLAKVSLGPSVAGVIGFRQQALPRDVDPAPASRLLPGSAAPPASSGAVLRAAPQQAADPGRAVVLVGFNLAASFAGMLATKAQNVIDPGEAIVFPGLVLASAYPGVLESPVQFPADPGHASILVGSTLLSAFGGMLAPSVPRDVDFGRAAVFLAPSPAASGAVLRVVGVASDPGPYSKLLPGFTVLSGGTVLQSQLPQDVGLGRVLLSAGIAALSAAILNQVRSPFETAAGFARLLSGFTLPTSFAGLLATPQQVPADPGRAVLLLGSSLVAQGSILPVRAADIPGLATAKLISGSALSQAVGMLEVIPRSAADPGSAFVLPGYSLVPSAAGVLVPTPREPLVASVSKLLVPQPAAIPAGVQLRVSLQSPVDPGRVVLELGSSLPVPSSHVLVTPVPWQSEISRVSLIYVVAFVPPAPAIVIPFFVCFP